VAYYNNMVRFIFNEVPPDDRVSASNHLDAVVESEKGGLVM